MREANKQTKNPFEALQLYCIMGRGRKGLINQSQMKAEPSRGQSEQGMQMIFFFRKNIEEKKMFVPEQTLEFMKGMNPQQLADVLLIDDDDWFVKTSRGNASGS